MPTFHIHTHKNTAHSTRFKLGLLGVFAMVIVAGIATRESLEGRLVAQPKVYPWVVITSAEVMSGTLIPADSHVIFHLPESFTRITRETLLGLKGKRVRYWGYCFPANYDPKNVSTRSGFPGLVFLSEEERLVQKQLAANRKPRFSISTLPSDAQVQEINNPSERPIRHQLEVFKPSTMCYIMTEEDLAIGLDPDGDRLNDKLESEINTDPQVPDSDGDGLSDGVEYIGGTLPHIRDTDSDGIIDGIEDADWDGRIDPTETDPRNIDSDRDRLCDGMCRIKLQNRYIYAGEDKNLNGMVDEDETDPRLWDSDGDGSNDEVEFLQCIAAGKDTCF